MTGYIYRASWPILDQDRPISALRAEACGQVDEMAQAAGCRITGEIRWTVRDLRLYAEAPATPLARRRTAYGSVASRSEEIRQLAGQRMSDRQIAVVLDLSIDAVRKVRQRNNIPPGGVVPGRRALGDGQTEEE